MMNLMVTTHAPRTFGVRQGGGIQLGDTASWMNSTPWFWGLGGLLIGGLGVYFGIDRHCRR